MRHIAHRPVDPASLYGGVTQGYLNERVASVNDHEVRVSVMTEAFGWHVHPGSDETFLVLEGELGIGLEGQELVLGPGQMFTVPRGTVHRTRPIGERSVNLTFERDNSQTVFVSGPADSHSPGPVTSI